MTDLTPLQLFIGLCGAYYSIVNLGLIAGLRRTTFLPNDAKPFVSVIVAARNEAANIGTLLEHLRSQDYPSYEIIIVNDRSTDDTGTIVDQYRARCPNLYRVDVNAPDPSMPSKKNALAKGIEVSRGTILCLTDADCLPPSGWISALVSAFSSEVGLVAGYSPYLAPETGITNDSIPGHIFYRFLQYEEFRGAAWAAGSIGMKLGWLCTGRSLAYRREVYDEIGGFEGIKHSVSGDDDLFLQRVRRSTSWAMRYVTDPRSHVPTNPPSDVDEFLRQRTRHFSAGRHFSLQMKVFFFLYHGSNLALLLALPASLLSGFAQVMVPAFILKCLADAALYYQASSTFQMKQFRLSFFFMEFLYVFYIALIGPLGFVKRFEWKPGPTVQ